MLPTPLCETTSSIKRSRRGKLEERRAPPVAVPVVELARGLGLLVDDRARTGVIARCDACLEAGGRFGDGADALAVDAIRRPPRRAQKTR